MELLERIEITRQPKQQADITALLDEISHSPFIGDISVAEIEHLLAANTVLLFYDDTVLAGLAAWDIIDEHWIELGPFYTAEAYRGQGIGGAMFEQTQHGLADAGYNLYGITKNPIVKRMFVKYGFHQVSPWTLPRDIWWFLLKKFTLRKVLRHLTKLRLTDSVAHFVKTHEAKSLRL